MNEMHEPPGGDSQDFWPTQDLGPGPPEPGQPAQSGQAGEQGWGQAQQGWGQASGQPGQAGQAQQGWGQPSRQPGYQSPGPSGRSGQAGYQPGPPGPPNRPGPARRRGRAVWWGAGLALIALVAGGAVAAAELTSSSSPAPAGPTGSAAELNTMLNSAASPTSAAAAGTFGVASSATPGSAATAGHPCLNRAAELRAAGHPNAAKAVLRLCRNPLARARLVGGIHGSFTFDTASGPRTLAYERGVIESVSGSDVLVQAKDGTTWTWVLEGDTVIRESGQQASTSALADGETVFAGGPVVNGTYEARLIVIRPPAGSPSPVPSSSSAAGS